MFDILYKTVKLLTLNLLSKLNWAETVALLICTVYNGHHLLQGNAH